MVVIIYGSWIYNYMCNQYISPLKAVSSNPVHGEVISKQHNVIKFVSDLLTGQLFSPGTPVSSTNKTARHDITETFLEVAFNTITLTPNLVLIFHICFCIF